MRRQHVYVDTSVIGGCEDEEFSEDSRALWQCFCEGSYMQLLSEHTLRELSGAPANVRARIEEIPRENQIILPDSDTVSIGMGKESEEEVSLTFDGQVGFDFSYGDRVVIHKSKNKIKLIKSPDQTYFEILRAN